MIKRYPTRRRRFSAKRRREGEQLANALRDQAGDFPAFALELEECIARITAQAQRTRASDRELVLGTLREWQTGLGARDIMEDTGLSHWDVRQILYELLDNGVIVEIREPLPGVSSRHTRTLYVLKAANHTQV